MDAILAVITSDGGRYVLSLISGFMLTRNPGFMKKAIPMLLGVLNVGLAIVNGLAVPPAQASVLNVVRTAFAVPAAQAVSNVPTWHWGPIIFAGVVTWLLAVGTHSTVKNTWQLRKKK